MNTGCEILPFRVKRNCNSSTFLTSYIELISIICQLFEEIYWMNIFHDVHWLLIEKISREKLPQKCIFKSPSQICVHVCVCVCVCARARVHSVMSTVSPGSFGHGISQAKNTGVGCIFCYRGSSPFRDRTLISCVSWIGRQILYHCTTWEALPFQDTNLLQETDLR